jgi:hypothetical protein
MIHSTRKHILINELTEEDKGEFVEMSNDDLQKIISGLKVNEEQELGNYFDFNKVYDAEYYSSKFPGFDDEVYNILEKETMELNREIPTPLIKSNDEITFFKK